MAKASLHPLALLLLGLPFLAFADDVPVMTDVDVTKLAGKWYPVKTIQAASDPVEIHAFTLEPTADGGIVTNLEIPQDGACTVKKAISTKKSPGVFTSSDGEATVIDTDYKTYLFAHLSNSKVRILVLYGREKKVPKEIKKKFKALVKKVGMKPARRLKVRKKEGLKEGPGLAQRAKPVAAEILPIERSLKEPRRCRDANITTDSQQ
ncbi:beta-lactoglobulin-like [Anolis sagrei]|uniref:beta-lactoglobulin-like n=1 Tax=Anolis sagrei TaxID=38937 RepID=UPI003522DB0F